MSKKPRRLGKLPPGYRFSLNHYPQYRFTTCPQCDRLMKVRKHPFFIHVDPAQPALLNMSGRYCPGCDLLIVHQDQHEELLTMAFINRFPDLIGNENLVVGTVERNVWRAARGQPLNWQMIFDNLHDFKEAVIVEVEPAGWRPAED